MKKYGNILFLAVPVLVIFFAIIGAGIGDAKWLGMKVEALNKSEASQMSVPANTDRITVVALKEPALSSGIIVGDVIVGINGKKIHSVSDFLEVARTVMTSRGRDGRLADVVLTLNRLGDPTIITIPSEWVEASIRKF